MATPETEELHRRIQRFCDALDERDLAGEERFVDILDTLHRLAGKPSIATEAARFTKAVVEALERTDARIVTERPRGGGLHGQPDLVVEADGETYLVHAKGPLLLSGASVLETVARLDELRDALGAEHAFLVVPYRAIPLVRWDRVSIVTRPQLVERIRQSSNRNEVKAE